MEGFNDSDLKILLDISYQLHNYIELKDTLKCVIKTVKKISGFEAVGIRLYNNGDYPYYVYEGFPEEFIKKENELCTKDKQDNRILLPDGKNYLLDCMCGNVIRGKYDDRLDFFTKRGSFFCNSTSELLMTTSAEDRQGNTRNYCNSCGYESVALIPIRTKNNIIGLIQLNDKCKGRLTESLVQLCEKIGEIIGPAVQNNLAYWKIRESYQDIKTYKRFSKVSKKKNSDNKSIDVLEQEAFFFEKCMKRIQNLALRYHNYPNATVTIQGETGTGKEVIAKIIHYGCDCVTDKPFIAVNCASIPDSLFESELFGYEGGSFTGSFNKGKQGKVDLAEGGTLFLDEIGDISPEIQVKLLRFIEEKEYYRIGGLKKNKVNLRIICATNANLQEKVATGTFRGDLYYRLNTLVINIPPLRKRKNDIIPLAREFLKIYSKETGSKSRDINTEAEKILYDYPWPGNVRELRNVIHRFNYNYDDDILEAKHLKHLSRKPESNTSGIDYQGLSNVNDFKFPSEPFSVDNLIDLIVLNALERFKGNKTLAASFIGMSRRALYSRLERISKKEML